MSEPGWLDEAKTAGALLLAAPDPVAASEPLLNYLVSPTPRGARLLAAVGIEPKTVDEFRALLPGEPAALKRGCELSVAWAVGRRSAPTQSGWAPVVTGQKLDRARFERRTAETLVTLIIEARSTLVLFTPYLDPGGIGAIAHALSAATARGVLVRFGYRAAADRLGAVAILEREIAATGTPSRLFIAALPENEAFPHLKVLVADGRRAYIGSANITYSGLTDNIEVGALVDGEAVTTYERLLDMLLEGHVCVERDSS